MSNVNPSEWGGSEQGAMNGESGERLADLLIEIVRRQPDVKTICDLGCGNGYLAGRLAKAGYQVTGIDGSRPYIETARRLYSSPAIHFEQAFFGPALVSSLPASFDLVVSSDVIEHLYRPADLLETAYSLVKPGGTVVVGTPYHGYLKNVAIAVLGKWDAHHGVHWDGGHIKFFSVATLQRAVEASGFIEPSFSFYGRVPGFSKNMICVARRPAQPAP